MRSILLICGTILLLAIGFFTYMWFQPAVAERPINKIVAEEATSRPSSTTKISGLGPVQSAWILRMDPKTGELASRFRGDRYDPQPGNMVLVDHPVAEFYSNDGKQRIHIVGQNGRVHVTGAAANQKPGQFAGKMEPPNRGLLNDVTVTIFEPAEATEPSVTIRMPNASFDNDAFRLETQSYNDEKGHHVDADQVPVELRGVDYDFDGKGLVLIWNERDRKLQLLEIAHGERLTIKNPKALNKPVVASRDQPGELAPLPVALASRDDGAAVSLIAENTTRRPRTLAQRRRAASRAATRPAPATTRKSVDLTPTFYRAIFHDNVRIFEAEKQVGTADQLNVDFLQAPRATTEPATQPTTRVLASNKPARAHPSPTVAPTAATTQAPAAQTASTEPASQPTTKPITITWTGKLHVSPIDQPTNEHLVPDKALVQLIGNPVMLDRDDAHIVCAQALYNAADQSADLRSSQSLPLVKMTDARGSIVQTPRMIYSEKSPREKFATLVGPSSAEIPDASNPEKKQMIKTRWQDRCVLQLTTDASNHTFIQHADLNGAVVVDHPQLNLTSEALALSFKPTKTQTEPQLREVLATGDVHARMLDDQGAQQTIATEKLRVETDVDPEGVTYARLIDAAGDVHTRGSTGDLRAGHLLAILKPTTRQSTTAPATQTAATAETQPTQVASTAPTTRRAKRSTTQPFSGGADLESLLAEDHVRFTTTQPATQPATATADILKIRTEDNVQRIHLIGTTQPATMSNDTSIITSNLITLTPDQNKADIPGPGKLHATSRPSGSRPTVVVNSTQPASTQPVETIDMTWTGSAHIDGNANRIYVNDGVQVISVQADKTKNTATAQRLVATLTTRPATTQAATPAPTTSLATTRPKNQSPMESKDIETVTLIGDPNTKVEVKSELLSADGKLLRGFNLFAETVMYDKLHGKMIVPVPGTMLYQDHRPSDQSKADGPTIGSGRGATAFEWKKSLVYSEPDHQATLTGDVAIVHRPENNQEQPFRLDAQTVIADLAPAENSTPTTTSSTKPSDKMSLKLVTARDHVHVTSTRATFDANELTFSPRDSLLTASGTDDNHGTLYDANNGSTASFTSLRWNTETDQFSITKANARLRR